MSKATPEMSYAARETLIDWDFIVPQEIVAHAINAALAAAERRGMERAAEMATARAAEYAASYVETKHKAMTLAGEAALISLAAAIRKAMEASE